MPDQRALLLLALLVFTTFGAPPMLGLSWFELPQTVFDPAHLDAQSGAQPAFEGTPLQATVRALRARSVGYPASLDAFSFGQVDRPFREIEARQLLQGKLPLWNARSSLGVPLAAQYENQVFFPSEWIEMFGGPVSWGLLLTLKVFLVGLGTYVFLRQLLDSPVACLAGAIAYAFSSYFLWFFPIAAFVTGAMLLPWLLWSVQRLYLPGGLSVRSVGLVGLMVGLLLLSGQPQMAIVDLLGVGVYVAALTLLGLRSPRQLLSGVALGLGAGLGLLIAAVMLRLFIEALSHGNTLHGEGAYSGAATSLLNFTLWLSPFFMGQLMWTWNPDLPLSKMNWEAFPMALGAFGALGVAYGLVSLPSPLKRDRHPAAVHLWALVVVGLAIIGIVALATAGFMAIWTLRGLDRVNLPRYGAPLLSFVIAVLIAWAVASVKRTTVLKLIVANIAVVALAGWSLWLLSPYIIGRPPTTDPVYFQASMWLGTVPVVVIWACVTAILASVAWRRVAAERAQAALVVCLAAQSMFFVRYGFDLNTEQIRLGLLTVMAASSILMLFGRVRSLAVVLAVIAVVNVGLIWTAPRGLSKARDVYTVTPPLVEFLRGQLGADASGGRALATRGVVNANVLAGYGVADLASIDPVQVDTTAGLISNVLVNKPASAPLLYTAPTGWPGMELEASQALPAWPDFVERRRFYNFLGARYLVDRKDGFFTRQSVAGVRKVFEDDTAVVYEDPQAFPRAFALSDVRVVPNPTDAINTILTPGMDLHRTAAVEDPDETFSAAALASADASAREVQIRSYADDEVELEVADGPLALVVLTDAYYPGWTARLDGEPQETYRVNGTVRGVVVPPGRHTLSFQYAPTGFGLMALVSFGALALCSVAIWSPWRRRSRDKKPDRPRPAVPSADDMSEPAVRSG